MDNDWIAGQNIPPFCNLYNFNRIQWIPQYPSILCYRIYIIVLFEFREIGLRPLTFFPLTSFARWSRAPLCSCPVIYFLLEFHTFNTQKRNVCVNLFKNHIIFIDMGICFTVVICSTSPQRSCGCQSVVVRGRCPPSPVECVNVGVYLITARPV